MRLIIKSIAVFSLLLPITASAVTADELRAQAAALIQEIQTLQTQTAQGTGVSVASNSASCPQFTRPLKRGLSGSDVTSLQWYLAQDPSVYPEGTVTGYYGALTEAAVQRWQAKNNIISSGTAATTGYGVVGPRTAAAITVACSGGSTNVSGSQPQYGGFIQVSPIVGRAPLTIVVQATINTPKSCVAAIYNLDFGDGSLQSQLQSPAGECAQKVISLQHAYQSVGTYKVTLSAGAHQTNATVTVTQ